MPIVLSQSNSVLVEIQLQVIRMCPSLAFGEEENANKVERINTREVSFVFAKAKLAACAHPIDVLSRYTLKTISVFYSFDSQQLSETYFSSIM